MIPSLRVLDLSYCLLARANQSLSHHNNLTNLEELNLSVNLFNHPVASGWFWNLTNLKHLSLWGNYMYGQLPNELGRMTSLQFLSLSGNAISIPTTSNMENLCNLKVLELKYCFKYGNVADLIESLPRCSTNRLQELFLGPNRLSGMLPNWMGHLTSLVILDLSRNNITGQLPGFVGNFASLISLDISSNHLTGGLPHEIGLLSNLTNLDLNSNDLHGLVTEEHFADLKSLEYIDLSYNNLLKIATRSDWQPPYRLHHANFARIQMGPLFPAWLQWQVDLYHIDMSNTGI